MLILRPPIMAALLGRVGSQSCETSIMRLVITDRSGKIFWAKKDPGTFTHHAFIRCGGFFLRGTDQCENVVTYFLLCSEQTTGNRGTQSFGTKRAGSVARVGASGNHEQRTRITDTALMSAGPPEDAFSGGF